MLLTGAMISAMEEFMNNPVCYLVMDGAWGSCGKGLLAGKLAVERNPDLVVCNYGPNAGHTYITELGEKIMTQQLPTGVVNEESILALGPGSIIDPAILAKEIQELSRYNPAERLVIHPRAAVVTPEDKEREGALVKIGSTRKGTASAATRKMMRVDEGLPRIAAEHEYLKQFVVTEQEYDRKIATASLIQVESAQGVELSLSRGYSYPTCTGRDVTPEQIMNDVAVPMRFLKETCVVIRTYPIRVGNEYDAQGNEIGHSGPVFPDQQELTWEGLSQMAGVDLMERTTVTKKIRRVFTFSKDQLAHALWITGPASIFLNYMNYLDPSVGRIMDGANDKAWDFYEELQQFVRAQGSNIKWLGWGPAHDNVEDICEADFGWVK